MDYGHDLVFGTFVTPSSSAVSLAQLSEQAGLDLVTFQDHPYRPAQLDTWTLMSYVAAATNTIHIAPNVLNLPLRQPSVVARAAASLDILSGGRFDLGIGAGAFWDAIAAMGGRRLSPGESIDALAEAIDVLRQVWDVDARGGVRVEGSQYRVVGAKRGPRPRHDIPIWIGAYKPRMLRLVGRLADGWLASLSYLQPGQLADGNRAIDDAAVAAGREPSAITRLLNVPSDLSVAQLVDLALEDGVSAFIAATDEPATIQRYAAEIAPAVREEVARARKPTAVPAVARTSFAVVPTPDDGVRLRAEQPWDDTTRPVGPPIDGLRTYTAHELASGRHLVDVHDHLRRELTRLRDLMEQVLDKSVDVGAARSELNAMTMRQNNWTLGTYCESYCRLVATHHMLEDRAVFPHLRRADPRLGPVLDRLQDEHEVIHEILEGLDRALVEFVGSPDGAAELRESVDLLTDALLSHLSYEERELVEPIARSGIIGAG